MKYLCLILYLQISFRECTIDINVQELVYLADHMTAAECRRLFASLHFSSYNLPSTLSEAEQKVPKDVPCVKLLIKWNSGGETFEGKGKTHAEVEHRLRQLGKSDLADWLGTMVFHNLVQVNKTLEDEKFFNEDKPKVRYRILKDDDSRTNGERWTTLDSILSLTLFSLLFIILAAFCRMLNLTFRRAKAKRKNCKEPEEIVDLLSVDSADSEDQETLYELEKENQKRSHVSFKIDFEKEGSEESIK